MHKKNPKIANNCAAYFFRKSRAEGKNLSILSYTLLVYIAHGWHWALYDKPLLDETITSGKHCPTIKSLKDGIKLGFNYINLQKKRLLYAVWEEYKEYTSAELCALTKMPNSPWSISKQINAREIDHKLIKAHYVQLMIDRGEVMQHEQIKVNKVTEGHQAAT